MTEQVTTKTWFQRGLLILAVFGIVMVSLVPLDLRPMQFAGPDVITVLVIYFAIHHNRIVPLGVVVCIFLFADMIYMRPPGLWTLMMIGVTEHLRRRQLDFQSMGLLLEAGAVATLLSLAAVLYYAAHILLAATPPVLSLYAMQVCATIIVYPFVVALFQFVRGLKKSPPYDRQRPRNAL